MEQLSLFDLEDEVPGTIMLRGIRINIQVKANTPGEGTQLKTQRDTLLIYNESGVYDQTTKELVLKHQVKIANTIAAWELHSKQCKELAYYRDNVMEFVLINGREFKVCFEKGPKEYSIRDKDILVIKAPFLNSFSKTDKITWISEAIVSYAQVLIKACFDNIAQHELLNTTTWKPLVDAVTVEITDIKKKNCWGYCSATGKKIVLSWRLIHLPIRLIYFVICHELTHLKHFDHSPAFYKTLAKLCPKHKSMDKEVSKLGYCLAIH